MITLHHLTTAVLAIALATGLMSVHAKLPAPSPEAKAKADETKAKTAHGDKVAAYKLCLAGDRVAAHYVKTASHEVKPASATPPCADPGPFVYTPADAASAVTVSATATVAADAAKPPVTPPLEAAGAHSPAKTATAPPSGKATAAEQTGTAKK